MNIYGKATPVSSFCDGTFSILHNVYPLLHLLLISYEGLQHSGHGGATQSNGCVESQDVFYILHFFIDNGKVIEVFFFSTQHLLTQICSEKVSRSRNRHCEWQAEEREDKTERLNSLTYRAVRGKQKLSAFVRQLAYEDLGLCYASHHPDRFPLSNFTKTLITQFAE